MPVPPIYVMRHGETEWNVEGRFQGRADSPLTRLGRAQARRLRHAVAAHDLIGFDARVSPLGRAFETAAIALVGQVRLIRTDDRLQELDVGDWTGTRREDIRGATLETRDTTPDGPFALYDAAPGGEGFAGLMARCQTFLDELSEPTLIVTHGITSRMLRTLAMGLSPASLGDRPGGQGMIHAVIKGEHLTLTAL